MAVTSYTGWLNDGRPANASHPTDDLARTLHAHGYNVGRLDVVGLGDDRHLLAATPEDHTPYSHTPWPGVQPYPWVLAADIMTPVPPGKPSLAQLGRHIFEARQAGRAQARWIKYMNWTDAAGRTWHDSWKPDHSRSTSTDKGHIHLSGRTDFVFFDGARHWDPVAEIMGGAMAYLDDDANARALAFRAEALYNERETSLGGEPNRTLARLKRIEQKIDALTTGGIDVAALAAALGPVLVPLLPAPLTAAQTREIVDSELDEQSHAGADTDLPAGP